MLSEKRLDIIASGLLCDLDYVTVSDENMDMAVKYLKQALAEEREMIAAWLESDDVDSAPWQSFRAAKQLRDMK